MSRSIIVLMVVASTSPLIQADVFNMPAGQTSIQMVQVGNPGNAADTIVMGTDGTTGYGSVGYSYGIGKYEVTIGQYAEFLNAVAKTDTYGLYSSSNMMNLNIGRIARSGSVGNFTYTPIDSPNQPIAYVHWGDAARFANWLTNGQPVGMQGPGTTETGSYALNGATSEAALQLVTRSANARYAIPTENEWYKAAYYDPTKGGSNYWRYPLRTDGPVYSAPPPGNAAPDNTKTGNFGKGDDDLFNSYDNGYAITGSPHHSWFENYLSDVGAYTFASNYYGTFDQGGNVTEWNETVVSSASHGIRGGGWSGDEVALYASHRPLEATALSGVNIGFRIALVPEPATLTLFGLTAAALSCRRKRIRA